MRLVILSADRQTLPAPQAPLGVGYTGRAPYIKVNDHQCLLCDKNHVTKGYPFNHFSVSTSTALSPSTLSCSPHPHPPSGLSSSSQTGNLCPLNNSVPFFPPYHRLLFVPMKLTRQLLQVGSFILLLPVSFTEQNELKVHPCSPGVRSSSF